MAVTPTAYGPAPNGTDGVRSAGRDAALGLAGLSFGSASNFEYFDDFTGTNNPGSLPNWRANATGSATVVANVAGSAGGVAAIQTSGTASQSIYMDTVAGLFATLTTSRFYTRFRFRITTAPTDSINGVGVMNFAQNKFLMMGAVTSLNASNFIVQHSGTLGSGSSVDLGVPFDTAFHIGEIWGLGTTTFLARLDGGATFSATYASPPADAISGMFAANNGTTAANRRTEIDYYYAVGVRI